MESGADGGQDGEAFAFSKWMEVNREKGLDSPCFVFGHLPLLRHRKRSPCGSMMLVEVSIAEGGFVQRVVGINS